MEESSSAMIRPRAVLLENLDALVTGPKFAEDRHWITEELSSIGYRAAWRVLDAADFGVPQFRKSGFLVALPDRIADEFQWPTPIGAPRRSVGEVLRESM